MLEFALGAVVMMLGVIIGAAIKTGSKKNKEED